jgi:rubrerythrin
MVLHTTTEVIGLAKSLEEESANFYRKAAGAAGNTLIALADENKKYIAQIERAYYGVITDALEGCFSFSIDPAEYTLATLTGGMPYTEALKKAVAMEEKIISFYTEAARQSESLMADIPRAFRMVARKRTERVTRLRTLISEKEKT